jgi:NodT family efflux transporter outer membrane factor (OMF) lipoprotein
MWVRPVAVAVCGAGLMLLTGCSGDTFEPSLTFALPARFEAAKTTKSSRMSLWWRRFGSSELDRLMDAANFDNFDIAVAVSQLKQADAQARIAGAALWPTIGYADNNSHSQFSGTTVPGVITRPLQRDSFSKVINASYIADVWGQNRDALEAALHTSAASAYQVEVVRLTTEASVVNNFLIYAANRERVSVGLKNLRDAEEVLSKIEERRAAGTASELDTAQQKTLVEIQRANIPPLRQAAEAARAALAILVGQPLQTVQLRTRSVQRLHLPAVLPGLPASLLVRRPDIRNAEEQLAAADANVDVARKAFLPTVQLTGQAGLQSALFATLLRPESFIYSVAAGLTQPIFDGDKLRGQLALSEAQRQELLEIYRKAIVSALSDVENALVAIRESALKEKAQRDAVAAATVAFQRSKEKLDAGTIDLTTLATVEMTLFQAEDTLIQDRLARLQAVASLFQALGGDWQEPAGFSPTR